MNSLKNKVVVVTGASSGIGKALAEICLSRGVNVVMVARRMEVMEDNLKGHNNDKATCLLIQADVSIEADCQSIINKTIDKFGRIDVLINNAGVSMRGLFQGLNLDVMHKLMNVNFWGTVYCTHYAMPYIKKSKGTIVGVSSIAGYKGLPARTGYSASKFAIRGFLETLRIENLKSDIHIMIACPGFTESNIRKTAYAQDGTQQGESPRNEKSMMTADEVAREIIRGIEKRKRTVLLTMQGKLVVWISKFFPAFVDKLVYNNFAKEPDSPLEK